ncbi:MAG TPA: non-ribosomal peptide synthetase [Candidatus Angelobacter sp.]|nr:non-ribosomal peptide synthetase [Candidatus Angelobacter sp.]
MASHAISVAAEVTAVADSQLDEQQRHRVLFEWNETATRFPETTCVHELFADQARRTPDAVAISIGEYSLSYGDLERRANQLAHHLRELGVIPEVVVGLCTDRSLEMVIGLLAILKSGGAYLPIDKDYPHDHMAYLLKQTGVSVVVCTGEARAILSNHSVHTVVADPTLPLIAKQPTTAPVANATSQNLAYVMYTSGSSGTPKGVGVLHSNINRLVRNTNYVEISPDDVFLQLAPITFDAATFEIWGALLNGARLVLYPPDRLLDLAKLRRIIQNGGVSILWLTAGLFHAIVDADLEMLGGVRQLLAGGDVVSAPHVKKVIGAFAGCRVINGYGPTEGTTFSVCFPVREASGIEDAVPIGRPVANTTVYVLDSRLAPVPIGETGELLIGGAGLARGYFNHPELTAEAFIPNPFAAPATRLYRTGDVVRYTPKGVLEFIGRQDFQVKVRGYRIELEEVEAALVRNSNVLQAAVAALPDPLGNKRLVAFVVLAGGAEPNPRALRDALSSRLPEYMVPSHFVFVREMPLTANGKVDRKALLASESSVNVTPLQDSGLEGTIAEIWAAALGVKEVGVNEDFFDLGGTSLALINIVLEMSKRFAMPLDTSIVAGGATVSALAQAVRKETSNVVPSCFGLAGAA